MIDYIHTEGHTGRVIVLITDEAFGADYLSWIGPIDVSDPERATALNEWIADRLSEDGVKHHIVSAEGETAHVELSSRFGSLDAAR